MLKIGIVGLPNVGKSTLFNALLRSRKAEAQNYPFCTIEPNVGVVEVPDKRLEQLAFVSGSQKIIPAAIEFVDIAGLVAGASQGQGLGNKFLSHIREVDAIIHVVRAFDDKNIIHVGDKIDIKKDLETINIELALADLQTIEKRKIQAQRAVKNSADKKAKTELALMEKLSVFLEKGEKISGANFSEDEEAVLRELHLLSRKKMIYAVNCGEDQLKNPKFDENLEEILRGGEFVKISAKLEQELIDLPEEEAKNYLDAIGVGKTGLDRLIVTGYRVLDLITFFTSGEPETRAWTIKKGAKAPEAAGTIHTDFIKGFIKAEVVDWKDFVENKGWNNLKQTGKLRLEGKEYIVQDGDVCFFHVRT